MHYAIPEHLKDEFGVAPTKHGKQCWTSPPMSPLLSE